MEFQDQDGCKRFFRLEYQLKRANNATLKFLQSKLNPEIKEKGIFFRTLQRQIDENEEVYGRHRKGGKKKND